MGGILDSLAIQVINRRTAGGSLCLDLHDARRLYSLERLDKVGQITWSCISVGTR